MTRRRWIADQVSGDRATLVGSHAEHLSRVLRAKVGQEFDIATGTTVRRGKISAISPDQVEFNLGEEVLVAAVPNITLVLSIFKFDRMEWTIEKCTELGVSQIIPLIAQRSENHLVAASSKRLERWRKIAKQASEQSRRATTPEISSPIELKELVRLRSGVRILLAEDEQETSLAELVDSDGHGQAVSLACGPEGGWTKTEVDTFRGAGWLSASLGPTILRAETAAISALAVVLSRLH
ncbi:MAG: 16S rRNA (uracil(1498)-N(3))-methyltransferase [Acidobacteriota bacterium]|jgi:16S rRNA (uracil1498-N3)-methyltransferase|nr:16S rRNA (uracil(1498)-N(3))-methyltransferase [Acidobacteriota bacterium]